MATPASPSWLNDARAIIAGQSGSRRRNKYRVSPVAARTVDGIRFDSKAESVRYRELRLLLQSGAIRDLELQPVYVLLEPYKRPDGTHCRGVRYIADFRYLDLRTNRIMVEDVKGVLTKEYVIKKAFFQSMFPEVNFREIKRT